MRLFLLSFVATVVSASSWFAAHLTSAPVSSYNNITHQLIETTDFRGRYGSLALFVGERDAVQQQLTPVSLVVAEDTPLVSSSETMYVLEFDFGLMSTRTDTAAKLATWQKQTEALVESLSGLELFLSTDGVILATANSDFSPPMWPEYTAELTAPDTAYHLPPRGPPEGHPLSPYYNYTTDEFDFTDMNPEPLIRQIVGQISGSNILSWVQQLSAIFSRLSTAAGARTAEDLLVRHYPATMPTTRHSFRTGMSSNVIAEIRGVRFPNSFVLIGAHYDSRSTSTTDTTLRAPGADDNGSGTAAIMELVDIIRRSNIQFDYSVRFLHWSGEEQGLLGSRALAQQYRANNLNVVCYLNLDMAGYRLPTRDIVVGMKDRSVTPWLLQATDQITRTYVPETRPGRSASCCSDYLAFFENGFATVGYFENEGGAADYPHYHRSTDTPDRLVAANLQAVTRAFVAGFLSYAVPSVRSDQLV